MEYSAQTEALGEELDRASEPYHKVKAQLAEHTASMEKKAEGDIYHVPSFEDMLLAARLERRYAALRPVYKKALKAYRESRWAEERANPDYDPVKEFFDDIDWSKGIITVKIGYEMASHLAGVIVDSYEEED